MTPDAVLAIDELIIARAPEPPALDVAARAFASAGAGRLDAQTTLAQTAPTASDPAVTRVVTWVCEAPQNSASAKITIERHAKPVTVGMTESALARLARGLRPEEVSTLRAGSLALDVHAQLVGGSALPFAAWVTRCARILVDLVDGVMLDPAAQRVLGRTALSAMTPDDPAAHITIHNDTWGADSRWIHTHGLAKFGRPELDLRNVPAALEAEGMALLRDVMVNLVYGAHLASGQEVELEDAGLALAFGAAEDADHQSRFGRLQLAALEHGSQPSPAGAQPLVVRLALADAERLARAGDRARAHATLERVLSAEPDNGTAMTLLARMALHQGDAEHALQYGELMSLQTPGDYRGHMVAGQALASMGRLREALLALNRAIEREPEAADAFAVRAMIYRKLGEPGRASLDSARAEYLRV